MRALGILSAMLLLTTVTACGGNSSSSDKGKVQVAVSQRVADVLPVWIAQEAGYFRDEGLTVELKDLPSSQGIPALVSGQVQLASIGAGEVLSAQAQGTDMSYLATMVPVFSFGFYAKPEFKDNPSALKGKRIGITSTSGSVYLATLEALRQLGLSKDDVQLVPLKTAPNVNAALLSGSISAAVSHPPATIEFEKQGLVKMVDLAKQRVPYAQMGIATTAEYAKDHSGTSQKFVDAVMRGFHRERTDKAFAEKTLKKYLDISDPAQADATYAYYAHQILPKNPAPTSKQFELAQHYLSESDSSVSDVDLGSLVDTKFVDKAAKNDQSG